MAKALTDVAVRNLKPRAKRYEVPDGGAKGLRVVVQPSGVKSYAVRYRFRGRMTKLTLGDVSITLAAARKLAGEAMFELAQGHRDPAEAKREAKHAQAAAVVDSLRDVAERYMKIEGVKLRSAKVRQQILDRHVYPALGDRPIGAIRRSEIVRVLDGVEIGSGPVMADMVLKIVARVMSWHMGRSDDFASPIVRDMKRVRASERVRERILSDEELRAVWRAAETMGPFGRLIKFLILTGARRNEALHLRWSELSNGGSVWTLPSLRNKVGRELTRPLSKAAQSVLADCPRIDGCDFVFTVNGRNAIGGRSRLKRELDESSGTSDWVLHDLRRVSRSLMSRAGVPSDHAERCLGHVISGVRGVYDKHRFVDEMLVAYERLASLVQSVVDPQPNVVSFAGRG
jgi:integrase